MNPTEKEMIKALQEIYKVISTFDKASQKAVLKAASVLIGNKS